MAPTDEIGLFLEQYPSRVAEQTQALRRVLRGAVPGAPDEEIDVAMVTHFTRHAAEVAAMSRSERQLRSLSR